MDVLKLNYCEVKLQYLYEHGNWMFELYAL